MSLSTHIYRLSIENKGIYSLFRFKKDAYIEYERLCKKEGIEAFKKSKFYKDLLEDQFYHKIGIDRILVKKIEFGKYYK